MKEIKLIVDGKEVQLTEEQIKVLGFEVEKNPFERCRYKEKYFYVGGDGKVTDFLDLKDGTDKKLYLSANYCTDKELMTKRAKQEVLNRMLWSFSMENGWDDSLWDDRSIPKYRVNYDSENRKYFMDFYHTLRVPGAVYFVSEEIAQRAINEIIIPFEKGELEVCKIWEE